MKKTSKYLGMRSGDWECTYIGVASVQSVYKRKVNEEGKKERSKYAGHKSYYYVFERLTSDRKAMKMIRLNANQVRQVLDGLHTVAYFANKKKNRKTKVCVHKLSYSFCD